MNVRTMMISRINTSFATVRVRPDEDYAGGAGWRWSFGRQNLWRLGFADGKVRFEVAQSAFPHTPHAADATYALQAGRWTHLAGTMTSGANTNLSLYVNGALVGWDQTSAYQARDGGWPLRLGWDEASGAGARFQGVVDEFRLYKAALSPDAVRGLMWFLDGKNGVLLPRGVFFDSKLFALFNGSGDVLLVGANINGNDNKGTAHE